MNSSRITRKINGMNVYEKYAKIIFSIEACFFCVENSSIDEKFVKFVFEASISLFTPRSNWLLLFGMLTIIVIIKF